MGWLGKVRDTISLGLHGIDPDTKLVVTTALREASSSTPSLTFKLGSAHVAAAALRHPLLREHLAPRDRGRLRKELLAIAVDERPRTFMLPTLTEHVRARGARRASFGDYLRALLDELPLLRVALAGFDVGRADVTYRARLELREPAGEDQSVVDVFAVNDDRTTMDHVMTTLGEDFGLSPIDAFYATHATHLHGAAWLATLPREEAERRKREADARSAKNGYAFELRLLRPNQQAQRA